MGAAHAAVGDFSRIHGAPAGHRPAPKLSSHQSSCHKSKDCAIQVCERIVIELRIWIFPMAEEFRDI